MASGELSGLRIAIYARFSSEHQREASIEDQVRRCREYVRARGGAVPDALVFADRAMSGASMNRPALAALMRLATQRPRDVDVVVVEDLSRLSRDEADLFQTRRLLEFAEVRLLGVADGIDTAASHSTLTFGMKSLVASIYLKDLSDKTARGLKGRALQGYSTGGLPYGYRSRSAVGADGRTVGAAIEIDRERADVVLRICGLYLQGRSLAAIAGILNSEKVPSPRAHTRSRNKSWVHTTIRAILHNRSYIGEWSYGARKWRKEPGTGKRRPTARDAADVLQQHRPHLRIIDENTWDAVQERLVAVRAQYTRSPNGAAKGRALQGRATPYPFSGLLFCGVCGAPMIIVGGSSARYYYCANNRKRQTCTNKLSVREDITRSCLLDELRSKLASPARLAQARKRVAEQLGDIDRQRRAARSQAREQLDRIEAQIEKLVDFIANGGGSATVAQRLKTLEGEATRQKRALRELEQTVAAPVRLPTPEDMLRAVLDLEKRLTSDTVQAREELRRYFRDGRIVLMPQEGGFYVAKSAILPLTVLATTPPQGASGRRYPAVGCAGRI